MLLFFKKIIFFLNKSLAGFHFVPPAYFTYRLLFIWAWITGTAV